LKEALSPLWMRAIYWNSLGKSQALAPGSIHFSVPPIHFG
jgi:hypothetical protein